MRIAMNNPELYNASNEIQRQDVLKYLKQNSDKIKWKAGDTAIDLGCGDGSVSSIVKKYSPYGFKKFVASDVSEEMVKFGHKHYADDGITFRVLDIEGDLPEDMVGAFNHVFSFYALHWVKKQEKGFKNIYDLLTDDGDCFLVFLKCTAIYDVYMALADHPKWKSWLKDVDVFVSPYHSVENANEQVTEIMEKTGFQNIDVKCKKLTSVYDSVLKLKNIVQAVEPFNMPNDVFDEFFKDYLTAGQKIGAVNISVDDDEKITSVTYDYALMFVCGNK